MTTAQTAHEAFDRYRAAFDGDLLIQSTWHKEIKGRHLACGLGVLGEDVTSPSSCPAQIMPRWLAQQVVWFFDGQNFNDAKAWGLKFYEQISRLNGQVPFSVIHDWHATIVGPLAVEVSTKRKRNIAAHEALMAMQTKAAAGEKFTADEWRPILKGALTDANAYAAADADAYAYAYADAAYAYADADANADANANDADANADTNANDANAYAYANDANAYAYANANAYADAYANAADADAYAYAYANAKRLVAKRLVVKRLADGMVECLARVQTPQ